MRRKQVTFTWEDPEAQKVFAEWCAFPDEEKSGDQANAILKFLGARPPLRVLDVGCGNGRLTVELAKRGFHVVGIDVAEHFLAQAKRHAKGVRPEPEFRLQRGADLQENRTFDLVLAYWFTLGFMKQRELRATFSAFHRALKPGGSFLLVFAGARAFPGRSADMVKNWAEKDGKFMLSEKSFVDGHKTEHCIVIDTNKGEITDYTERQRGVSRDEILDLMKGAGFIPIKAFKDFSRRPATVEDFSVFHGRKPAENQKRNSQPALPAYRRPGAASG